jgi:hypothetical protein
MGTFRLRLHETKSGRDRKNGSIGLSGLTGSPELKKEEGRRMKLKRENLAKKFQEESVPFALGRGKKLKVAVNKFKEEVRLEEGKK